MKVSISIALFDFPPDEPYAQMRIIIGITIAVIITLLIVSVVQAVKKHKASSK
jgi:hypothetical protein